MPIHFEREVNKLKQAVFSLSAAVQKNLQQAIQSMEAQDTQLAQTVKEADDAVDEMEIYVEEECLKILALYQPIAGDLRLIVSLLKIDNDLERIGDFARDIAELVIALCERPRVVLPFDWKTMTEQVQWTVKSSLEALVNLDLPLAYQVCQVENEIDALCEEAHAQVKTALLQGTENTESLLDLWAIFSHLENIADHAKKIAEDAIYHASGEIVRHKPLGELSKLQERAGFQR